MNCEEREVVVVGEERGTELTLTETVRGGRGGGRDGGKQERLRRGEERRREDRGLVEEDQSGREKVEATMETAASNMQPSAVDFAIENKHGRAQGERERGSWIPIG